MHGTMRADPPLMEAAGKGRIFSARLLLLKGANPNQADFQGSTPLSVAAATGNFAMVELLLWVGAEPKDVVIGKGNNQTAIAALLQAYRSPQSPYTLAQPRKIPAFVEQSLQNAAKRGDFESLQRLLDSGTDINARDASGKTALHRAIGSAQDEVIFFLLMTGASPNVKDNKGATPLMWCMGWQGWTFDRYLDMLVLAGADIHAKANNGVTELAEAARRGSGYGTVQLLGLGADPREKSAIGTPLELAFEEGQQPVIDLLRVYGVNDPLPFKADPVWNYHNAIKRGDLDRVKQSLAGGIKVDVPDAKGHSGLINAIYSKRVDVARFLIEHGADRNYRNPNDSTTPIWATVVWDFSEMTEFRKELLESGVDPNVPVKNGQTPLIRALWHKPTTPILQLVQYGADINKPDSKGRTPLRIARDDGKTATAEWLVGLGAKE